ncbi:hypothetical protein AAY473_014425, partial [Plecturocebus cupreus]
MSEVYIGHMLSLHACPGTSPLLTQQLPPGHSKCKEQEQGSPEEPISPRPRACNHEMLILPGSLKVKLRLKSELSREWWLTPIIPALGEAEAGGSLEDLRVQDQPGKYRETKSLQKIKQLAGCSGVYLSSLLFRRLRWEDSLIPGVVTYKTGFHLFGQAGLELLTSSDLPAWLPKVKEVQAYKLLLGGMQRKLRDRMGRAKIWSQQTQIQDLIQHLDTKQQCSPLSFSLLFLPALNSQEEFAIFLFRNIRAYFSVAYQQASTPMHAAMHMPPRPMTSRVSGLPPITKRRKELALLCGSESSALNCHKRYPASQVAGSHTHVSPRFTKDPAARHPRTITRTATLTPWVLRHRDLPPHLELGLTGAISTPKGHLATSSLEGNLSERTDRNLCNGLIITQYVIVKKVPGTK